MRRPSVRSSVRPCLDGARAAALTHTARAMYDGGGSRRAGGLLWCASRCFLLCAISRACYVYPADVKDPCSTRKCRHGATCVVSLDGRRGRCECPQRCDGYGNSRGSRPVCGSDGRDYASMCDMRRRACQEAKDVRVKYMGKCGEWRGSAGGEEGESKTGVSISLG